MSYFMGCHSYLLASPFLYNVVEALVKKSHKEEGKMDKTVDWAYEAWDEIVANLSHKDNHNTAIAAQILSNLAKSDPENRILKDFDKLLTVTKDERFVTARHGLQ